MLSFFIQNKPKIPQPSTLLSFIFKFLILVALIWFVWEAVLREQNQTKWKDLNLKLFFSQGNVYFLLMVLSLAPVNLYFEMMKWKVLVEDKELDFSNKDAFSSLMAGFALSYLLPFGIGDIFGRSLNRDTTKMMNRAKSSFLAGGIQFMIALFFGTLALSFLSVTKVLPTWLFTILIASWCSLGLVFYLILFRKPQKLVETNDSQKVEKFNFQILSFIKSAQIFFESLKQIPNDTLKKSLGFGLIRYQIFCLQLVLMFVFVQIKLNLFELYINTNLIFFSKSVIPTFNAFGDLGVREAASTFFFGFYDIEPTKVVLATLFLWIINVFFPMILGIFVLIYQVVNFKSVQK